MLQQILFDAGGNKGEARILSHFVIYEKQLFAHFSGRGENAIFQSSLHGLRQTFSFPFASVAGVLRRFSGPFTPSYRHDCSAFCRSAVLRGDENVG